MLVYPAENLFFYSNKQTNGSEEAREAATMYTAISACLCEDSVMACLLK